MQQTHSGLIHELNKMGPFNSAVESRSFQYFVYKRDMCLINREHFPPPELGPERIQCTDSKDAEMHISAEVPIPITHSCCSSFTRIVRSRVRVHQSIQVVRSPIRFQRLTSWLGLAIHLYRIGQPARFSQASIQVTLLQAQAPLPSRRRSPPPKRVRPSL